MSYASSSPYWGLNLRQGKCSPTELQTPGTCSKSFVFNMRVPVDLGRSALSVPNYSVVASCAITSVSQQLSHFFILTFVHLFSSCPVSSPVTPGRLPSNLPCTLSVPTFCLFYVGQPACISIWDSLHVFIVFLTSPVTH